MKKIFFLENRINVLKYYLPNQRLILCKPTQKVLNSKFSLMLFYDISNFEGYLMPNPIYIYIYITTVPLIHTSKNP